MLKKYTTINSTSETEIVINKSRFIGRAFPVANEEMALEILSDIRKKHFDATHNCYCYSLLDGTARYSDDGEPGGTAGLPMMEVLNNKRLTNSLCIVTRYFGGILLGSGGLVRAYSKAATAAVNTAGTVNALPASIYEIVVDYNRYGAVEGYLREHTAIRDISFLEKVTVCVLVKKELADGFIKTITEKTEGRSVPNMIGEDYLMEASCESK